MAPGERTSELDSYPRFSDWLYTFNVRPEVVQVRGLRHGDWGLRVACGRGVEQSDHTQTRGLAPPWLRPMGPEWDVEGTAAPGGTQGPRGSSLCPGCQHSIARQPDPATHRFIMRTTAGVSGNTDCATDTVEYSV